jgi:tetratricopeptide (TPR) repeat protein
VNALILLVNAQYDAGRLDEASETIDQLLTHPAVERPILPNVYITLGLIRRSQGQLPQALRAFEQALDLTSAYAIESAKRSFAIIALWQLAELHSENGDPDEAISFYSRLLEFYGQDDPHRPPLLNCLGTCHVALGHSSEARRYFSEVLASSVAAPEDIDYARTELLRLTA